ncbi:hypothetical protein JA1_001000 [Spathaspora sp. JA1]|nr:hypothetical protein JA1_001000 [Spathaspora sp. JA1]
MSVVQQGQVSTTLEPRMTPSTPSKRKSFTMLTPISPNRMLAHQRSLLKSPEKRERIISESTGLVKFSLSNSPAKKNILNKNSTTPRSGLPVYVPINSPPSSNINSPPRPKTLADLQTESRQLLEEYARKQEKLHEYERLAQVKKMELSEITQKIEAIKRQEVILSKNSSGDIYNQAYIETERELSKLKVVDSPTDADKENNVPRSLTKQMSQVFEVKTSTIKKQASFIMNQALDDLNNNIKNTNAMFSPTRNEDFKQLIQQSNVKLDDLAKQTSKFFNDVTSNFNDNILNFTKNKSPTKISDNSFIADSSFTFDNLKDEIDTNSIIYERSFEDSEEHIDIDECDSSFE